MSTMTEKRSVETRIVKIGNSQGIRIPKWLLEQSGLGEKVILEVQGNQIVIRRAKHPREGWAEQAKMMAEQGEDELLLPEYSLTTWDEEEWEW
ncbi:MAG: AbrB/MazE/SpoVT family DNA-binding domain-containing protein [Anaerolineae bacterium]|nr:AbrB/MazE/SpoVT family DNA-binding domain-containing protein [Anaerolineae bacterium]